ncbi:MAG TPA: molybdate ABC transporter substrate-binding protein, partial [Bacillaceae bacterium]
MALSVFMAGCRAAESQKELTVSAAASLQDALGEIKKGFEKENPGITLHFNFGGSGSLQQQISQGAPVDLFFSADADKFGQLLEEGFIDENNAVNLVGNELVLIVPKASKNQ